MIPMKQWENFSKHISYQPMDVTDAKDYDKIAKIAKDKEAEFGCTSQHSFLYGRSPSAGSGYRKKFRQP